jgi:hypothetical protein
MMTFLHLLAPPSSRLNLRVAVTMLSIAFCLPILATVCEARSNSSKWQTKTQVDQNATAPDGNSQNQACEPLAKNLVRHLATTKALNKDLEKVANAPPSTVYGALQGLLGNAPPNARIVEAKRKLESEEKASAEVRSMMRAAQCPVEDVERAVAAHPGENDASPSFQKQLPEDLVPLPQSR